MLPDLKGRPASVEIDGMFLQVVQVRRGGQLGKAGTSRATWRELFHVTLENGVPLTLIHDRAQGQWYARIPQPGPGILIRFPSAA